MISILVLLMAWRSHCESEKKSCPHENGELKFLVIGVSGFGHCIKGVSFVVFEQGINGKSKHSQLFFAKARGKVLKKLVEKRNVRFENTQILCSCCWLFREFTSAINSRSKGISQAQKESASIARIKAPLASVIW